MNLTPYIYIVSWMGSVVAVATLGQMLEAWWRKRNQKPAFITKYGTKVFTKLPRITQSEVERAQDAMLNVYCKAFNWTPERMKIVFKYQTYRFVSMPIYTVEDKRVRAELEQTGFGWEGGKNMSQPALDSLPLFNASKEMVLSGLTHPDGITFTIGWTYHIWESALAHEVLHGLRMKLLKTTFAQETRHINWVQDGCYSAIVEVNSQVNQNAQV